MNEANNKNEHLVIHLETLSKDDFQLIDAAIQVLKTNYHPIKHQVGCALHAASGKTYSAVNVYSIGYGIHAEAVALGMAMSSGEKDILSIVTVKKVEDDYPVISPCGNCRQLILDYASNSKVILNLEGQPVKALASDLLPGPYENSFSAGLRSGSFRLLQ